MRLTIQGALLFLFIPLVLFLYLRQPFGPGVSIVVGLGIMFGHRFLAAPWVARHATERCLWCGRRTAGLGGSALQQASVGGVAGDPSPRVIVQDSPAAIQVVSARGERVMAACSARHRDEAVRFLAFVARYRAPIAIGIFVPLVLLLAGSLSSAAGVPFVSHDWNRWQFRTIVAFTVVGVSFAYRGGPVPVGPVRSAFPLHNFFLLGIRNTLWVFRVVGAWWLVAGFVWILR